MLATRSLGRHNTPGAAAQASSKAVSSHSVYPLLFPNGMPRLERRAQHGQGSAGTSRGLAVEGGAHIVPALGRSVCALRVELVLPIEG